MRKRIVSLVLAFVLVLGLVPAVSAASEETAPEHGMTDIVGHWAEQDIAWVLKMGLFNGTSATTFDPNGTMTRGMFVTVLGRYAGVEPDDFRDWYLPELYTDVDPDAYYAPYINWATRHGITSGTGAGTFSPDAPITREQMAVFLVRFAVRYGYAFMPIRDEVPESFADSERVSGFAQEAVEVMRGCGIINGRTNSEGTFDFAPQALAARSECSAVFHRLMNSLVIDEEFFFEEPEEIALFEAEDMVHLPGDSFRLEYEMVPAMPTNGTLLWVSSDSSVLSVTPDGQITCNATGQADIYVYACNGVNSSLTIFVEEPEVEEPEVPEEPPVNDVYIGYKGESYESKCMNIFGRVVDDPRHPYEDNTKPDEFVANLVDVTVQVWDFKKGSTTEKVTKTFTISVHKNLAATVEAVFAEIYACEEQYPINYLGGYRWSNKSEHTPGLAIDVNYKSNPYMDPNGKIITGEKWDPENDPYAIPIDGEIEQIFEKYGFRRGTWWSSGYKDYMHFSFFGT